MGLAFLEAEYQADATQFDSDSALGRPHRRDAIACVLTVSDGWRDAARSLGGAFAGVRRTGLIDGKD